MILCERSIIQGITRRDSLLGAPHTKHTDICIRTKHKQLQQIEQMTIYNYIKRKRQSAVRNTIGFDSCRMRRGMVFHRKGVFTKKVMIRYYESLDMHVYLY